MQSVTSWSVVLSRGCHEDQSDQSISSIGGGRNVPAQAVINQGNAATGIGGGDTPGFPVTITNSGSYILSTNRSPPTGVDAIDITASNVTLDLNGFTIGGYQPCSRARP